MKKSNIILLFSLFLFLTAFTQADYSVHQLPAGLSGVKPTIDQSYLIDISDKRRALTLDYLERHNPELYALQKDKAGLVAITFDPKIVVIHYTVITDLAATIRYFSNETIEAGRKQVSANGALNVGVQFVVDRDGKIYQLYPETVMSRHAIGLNHLAIGIENIGNGDIGEGDKSHPLTEAQLISNVKLVKYLASKHPNIKTMVAHSEYRLLEDVTHPDHALFFEKHPDYRTEKVDPGINFMKKLRKNLKD